MDNKRKLDREPPLHEKVAWLALALLCSAVPGTYVKFSTRRQDHQGVDLFLNTPDGLHLRVDLTEGHWKTRAQKFAQNAEAKRRGRPTRWILVVDREPVVSVGANPCFAQAWERLATGNAVFFNPEEICPAHKGKCPLVKQLVDLGISLVIRLPPDYREIFGDIGELRARFE